MSIGMCHRNIHTSIDSTVGSPGCLSSLHAEINSRIFLQTEFFNIFHQSGIFYNSHNIECQGGPVSKRLALEHFKIISGKEVFQGSGRCAKHYWIYWEMLA